MKTCVNSPPLLFQCTCIHSCVYFLSEKKTPCKMSRLKPTTICHSYNKKPKQSPTTKSHSYASDDREHRPPTTRCHNLYDYETAVKKEHTAIDTSSKKKTKNQPEIDTLPSTIDYSYRKKFNVEPSIKDYSYNQYATNQETTENCYCYRTSHDKEPRRTSICYCYRPNHDENQRRTSICYCYRQDHDEKQRRSSFCYCYREDHSDPAPATDICYCYREDHGTTEPTAVNYSYRKEDGKQPSNTAIDHSYRPDIEKQSTILCHC